MISSSLVNNSRVIRNFLQRQHLSFFDNANRDWETAWQKDLTPWDLKGTISPPLVEIIENKIKYTTNWNALVPGCGTGYECIYLKRMGFKSVVGLDLSQTAIDQARKNLQQQMVENVSFMAGDFFNYKPNENYDFIFDYLFFAALDPEFREQWGLSMKRLLKPETGILSTLVFPLYKPGEDLTKGPPYPVRLEDYEKILNSMNFELIDVDYVIIYYHLVFFFFTFNFLFLF